MASVETGGKSLEKEVTKPKRFIDRYLDSNSRIPLTLALAMLYVGAASLLLEACNLVSQDQAPAATHTLEAPSWTPTPESSIAATSPEPSPTTRNIITEEIADLLDRLGEDVLLVDQGGGSGWNLVYEINAELPQIFGEVDQAGNLFISVEDEQIWVDPDMVKKDEYGFFRATGEDGNTYRFIAGSGWQEMETIQIMAGGEMVAGRVIEKSEIWAGEIDQSYAISAQRRLSDVSYTDSGLAIRSTVFGFLKQFRVVEFDLSSGETVKQMLIDMAYLNANGEEFVVRFRLQSLEYEQIKNFVIYPRLGSKYFIHFLYAEVGTQVSSQDLVDNSIENNNRFCEGEEECTIFIGGVGDNEISPNELLQIFNGNKGEFVDLTNKLLITRVDN